MQKFNLLFLFLLLFSVSAFAQLKVGSNPTTINGNAIFEMESTNKGMLLPRVSLTSTTSFLPLSAHVAGMVVYNLASAGDVTPGYYYNDGTQWVRLATGVAGPAGSVWRSAAGAPAASLGVNGDYYLNTTNGDVYSKSAGAYSIVANIRGATGAAGAQGIQGIQGATGPAGANGKTVLNGTTNPVATTGTDGDFFINTTTNTLFGPKAGGAWPAGVSLQASVTGTAPISVNSGVVSLNDAGVTTAKLNDGAVTAAKLSNMGAAQGEVLKWDGTTWVPTTDGSIYNGNGTLLADRVVSMTDKKLSFTSTATVATGSDFTIDNTTFRVDAVNNKVGIGVDVGLPTAALEVRANGGGRHQDALVLRNRSDAPGTAVGLVFMPTSAGTGATPGAIRGMAIAGVQRGANAIDLAFSRRVGTDSLEVMRLTNDGNIVIRGALMPDSLAGVAGQFLTSDGPGRTPKWSAGVSISVKSAAYTLLSSDNTIVCDAASAGFTLTIPTPAAAGTGKVYTIRKVDDSANVLTFSEAIRSTKSGATWNTFTTLNYARTIRIQSDGTAWYLID